MHFGRIDGIADRLRLAIQAARKYLFSTQDAEGYWCGELEADTTLESDYIFLHALLGTRNEERFRKAICEIARHQNEEAAGPSTRVVRRTSAPRSRHISPFSRHGPHGPGPAKVAKARKLSKQADENLYQQIANNRKRQQPSKDQAEPSGDSAAPAVPSTPPNQ